MTTSDRGGPRLLSEAEAAAFADKFESDTPPPVVVIIGGASNLDELGPDDGGGKYADPGARKAENEKRSRERAGIERLFRNALRPAVLQTRAVVITGGTDAGVMRMAGNILADVSTALIGVVPGAKTTGSAPEAAIDSNHSDVILTEGNDWGTETEFLFQFANRLTAGLTPGVVVFANGGPISFEEARRFIRGGWPVAALEGSGGKADELLGDVARSNKKSSWGDLTQADVEPLSADGTAARRQLVWRLHPDQVLKSAWSAYAAYDEQAKRLKSSATRWQVTLAAAATVLLAAVTATIQFAVFGWKPAVDHGPHELHVLLAIALWASKAAILLIPVGLAVAVALSNFSGSPSKWKSVRSSAETLKREIYRYRSRGTADSLHQRKAKERLTAVLRAVDDEAIRADVGLSDSPTGLIRARPRRVDPDELDDLTVKIYVKRRLEQQVLWFRAAARKRRRSEWRAVGAGAVAAAIAMTLLSTKWAPWVTLLVVFATTFTYIRDRGVSRQQVQGFDRAVADVNSAWVWWLESRPDQRRRPSALADFVDRVENAFERESLSWSEVMRHAAETSSSRTFGLG